MNNPFTISFGKRPEQFISRIAQTNDVLDTFTADVPSNQVYMITGVQGSGKTVLMTSIANQLETKDEWITIELNPARDMLESLAAKLYSIPFLHQLFVKAELDFSLFGLGVKFENATPVTDIETVLEKMLERIKKAKRRLLITIDEVTSNQQIKVFMGSFQIFLRQEQPIFLLMTGLYENIYDLQNEKSLTFLYRAPKIVMEPLNYSGVKSRYRKIFDLTDEEADEMTKLTKGYPFAFQVLGYLYWEHKDNGTLGDILPEYDQYLEEYVYEKIWSELSETDRRIVHEIAIAGTVRIKGIRESLGMSSSKFSVYRDRLKRRGIVDTRQYGFLSLVLPRFDEFVKGRDYLWADDNI